MSEELKPCPFCGETPQLFDIGKLVCCESLTCSGNQFPMLIRQWETRPIEDALKAEHADALRRETMAIESQHELEAEVARLKSALESYANPDAWVHGDYSDDIVWAGSGDPGNEIARKALEHKP